MGLSILLNVKIVSNLENTFVILVNQNFVTSVFLLTLNWNQQKDTK